MENKITLNKLLSFIQSISQFDENDEKDYNILSFKNDLVESSFKLLKFGEVNTLGDLPKTLKNIFDPFITDMKRVGVLPNKNKVTNVSLLYSILYCIKTDFLDLSNAEKINCIEAFTNKMLTDFGGKNLYKKYKYNELGWKKNEFIETLDKYKNNILTLRFLSEYLSINLFLLNMNEDKIYAIYPEKEYNVFKPSIFLSFYDNIFEPIIYNNQHIWRNEYDPLRKLINIDKKYIGILNGDFKNEIEKVFVIGSEDLSKYLPNKEEDEEIIIVKMEVDEKKKDEVNNDIEIHAKNDDHHNKNNKHKNDDKDNNYDEVYIKDAVIESEIYINDVEETEIDIQTAKNDKDIFYTSKKQDIEESDDDIIASINKTMKLNDLQTIAKKFGIDVANGKYKNGKLKMKTKNELFDDVVTKIKNE
jgi:hypothetical protein